MEINEISDAGKEKGVSVREVQLQTMPRKVSVSAGLSPSKLIVSLPLPEQAHCLLNLRLGLEAQLELGRFQKKLGVPSG